MIINDAHFHFDINSQDPVNELAKEFDDSKMTNGLLILNYDWEKKVYKENCDHEFFNRVKIAALISPNSPCDLDFFNFVKDKSGECFVKIHPRISSLEFDDFPMILNTLTKVESNCIIVDSFFFGPKTKSHIGIELAVYLAEALPKKKIIVAHSGGHKLLECMFYTRGLKNIFYDISLIHCFLENTSVEKDIIHFIKFTHPRIMYGSDHPDFSFDRAIKKSLSLCDQARLSLSDTENIMGNNFFKIYD